MQLALNLYSCVVRSLSRKGLCDDKKQYWLNGMGWDAEYIDYRQYFMCLIYGAASGNRTLISLEG